MVDVFCILIAPLLNRRCARQSFGSRSQIRHISSASERKSLGLAYAVIGML